MNRMHYSRELCPGINERNARTASRAEAAASFLLATMVGVFVALTVMHWCGWLL